MDKNLLGLLLVVSTVSACVATTHPSDGSSDASDASNRADAASRPDAVTSTDGNDATQTADIADVAIATDTADTTRIVDDVTSTPDVVNDIGLADVARDAPDAGRDVGVTPTDTGTGPRAGACSPAIAVPTPNVQTPRPKGSTCAALGYHEYVPASYASSHNWPLIIAFHGDGERGNGTTDLANVLNTGLPAQIQRNTWDPTHRFVVLSPQMDDRSGMTERTGPSVRAFIAFAIANYDVDTHRIYLIGLSGGGEPIYNYLGSEGPASVVAAVLPISGWYSTRNRECTWPNMPIWYFHGALDTTVPPANHSTISYNTLIACSLAPTVAPRYTMYAARHHDDWDLTYNLSGMNATTYPLVTTPPGTQPYDVSIYDWFLRYTR